MGEEDSNLDNIKSPLPAREFKGRAEPVISRVDQKDSATDNVSGNLVSRPTESKKVSGNLLKIIGIIVVVFLLFLLIFKVILPRLRKKDANSEKVVVNYWGLWEEPTVIEGLIMDFESKNPGIKIEYRKHQKDDYRSRLQAKLEKGEEGTDVPDIFRIHSSWIPMLEENLARVPKEISTSLQLDEDFYDVYKKDLKVDGSYLAIPLMYDGLSLFYNKDILDSAGKRLPKTWWGLSDLAKDLTVRGIDNKIKVAGVAMGLAENIDHWSDILGLMMMQNGVNLTDGSSDNLKKIEDILTFYTLFRTKYETWDETLPPSIVYFANGKLALCFAPSWRVFDIEMLNPNLNFGIGVVPQMPTLEGLDPKQIEDGEIEANLTKINWATYWVEGVNKKSLKQKEAFEFLSFLASKEGMEKMFLTATQIRSFGEISPRKSMMSSMSENEKIAPFVAVADWSESGYLSSYTWDNGLNDQMNKYFKDAVNKIVVSNASVQGIMPDLQNGINRVIEMYRLDD